eukprot:6873426-Ditylum_brightwellii.AAC.1
MGADSASLRIMANPLSSAPTAIVLDLAARCCVQCTLAALSAKSNIDMKGRCTCCRHMLTCKISAANSKSEFMMVKLRLASDMTFDDTSDGESQCHTNGFDSAKVVKMQPPAPSAATSQYYATEGSVLTSS